MSELVSEIQQLERSKGDAYDAARDEAEAENAQRDEDAFARMHDAAVAENNRANEESQEKARVQKIDDSITAERQNLSGASAEDLSGIVQRIQDLERQKTEPTPSAETETAEEDVAEVNETTETPEKEFSMSESELHERMEEIFALNRQIDVAGKEWYSNGIIEAHKLEDPIDAEIRTLMGVPEGTDLTADSFNGAEEILRIGNEVENLPHSEKAYPSYDYGTPDLVKRILAMNLSIPQRFGTLGKLQKVLSSSEQVAKLFTILDAVNPKYDEWTNLTKIRDEKAAEIQPDITARYGDLPIKNYIGMPESLKKPGSSTEGSSIETSQSSEDPLAGFTLEDYKEKFSYLDFPGAREAYAKFGADAIVDGKSAEEWLTLSDEHTAESDLVRDALYDKAIDGTITSVQKQALADYLIDHHIVANGELRGSNTSITGGISSSSFGPRWEELSESPTFAEVIELAKEESQKPGRTPV
jgi:hypothetical protein